MASDNERLGALVQRYQENSTRLAGLRASVDQKAQMLGRLAGALQRHGGPDVTATEDAVTYERSRHDGGGQEVVGASLLTELLDDLLALESAQREHDQLSDHVRQAGLTVIR